METQKSLWPLLLILILSVAIAGLFWWPRSVDAPNADENILPEEKTTQTTTPSPKPASSGSSVSSSAGKRLLEDGFYITIIEFTGTSFNPSGVEVLAGEAVRFVNKSKATMRVGTDEKLSSRAFSGFKQPDSVGYNGTFEFVMTSPGLWFYYNINSNPVIIGSVRVK